MARCPSCSAEIPEQSHFCLVCGAALRSESQALTIPMAQAKTSSSLDEGRFPAGLILAGRYRIVGLLGQGGMGEVYRASDLKLGQPVALKFLPAATAKNPQLLARFHAEVRIARQVSHPNVCRVYDIGEVDGATFLSMEYVDGEDLRSLLRRIGRLPPDKALEIARKLCAGLAAAHDKGVLHRDLKPAKIMIDGRGQVLIADFGLAALAGQLEGAHVQDGTPAYMAPEQLAGKEVSVRSDLYALGLVFHEMFTGKQAFESSAKRSTPTTVKDIDPLVERVILRCLDADPRNRPASALAVAAALPGGDPLAAALAAGDTPTPAMVAASGDTEGLRPLVAWALLAGVIVTVAAVIMLSAQTKLYRRVPLEKTPDVLAERARNILQSVGYSQPPVDTAMGFYEGTEFLRYIAEHDKSKTRWNNLETGAFVFWYRGSPRPLAVRSFFLTSDSPLFGFVWTDDPPLDLPAMTLVRLNPLGRLTQFIAVPPLFEEPAEAAPSPDWAVLFSAAGLDMSKWPPAQPVWTPPVYSDLRAAWTGSLVERPNIPLRIEAAAFRGKPVYFELIGPWTHAEQLQPYQPPTREQVFLAIAIFLLFSMLAGGAVLAKRNLRLGRGDSRGASRLSAVVLAAEAASYVVAHHSLNSSEIAFFLEYLVFGLAWACLFWALYMALEPYVRRRWPATLVSWSRLLAGGIRDPLVGRDVLVGCLGGAFCSLLSRLGWFVPSWFGEPPAQPLSGPQSQLLGAQTIIDLIVGNLFVSLLVALAFLFTLFLLRALLRKDWAAAVVFLGLGSIGLGSSVLFAGGSQSIAAAVVNALILAIFNGMAVFLIIRFGLLAQATTFIFQLCLLENFPFTTKRSDWYAGISLAGILLMSVLAIYAFYISLGGRAVFSGAVLEE